MRTAAFAFLLLVPFAALSQESPVPTRQVGTARLENVPEIPAEVSAAVQRYQNYREARFQDWLADGSLLITTRFGATTQVHRVAAPGAARTQLTFAEEPVAEARAIPAADRFVFRRDTGGDEWFQLYARGLAGPAAQLTEPGTRNESLAIESRGRLIAWSRAIRGSADYAVLTADPSDPATRRVAWQGTGAVGPADILAGGRQILLARRISNRETRLMVLDGTSGEVRELGWSGAPPARYEDARFLGSGDRIVAMSNAGSNVLRLVEIDVATGAREPLSRELPWDVESYDIAPDGGHLAYSVNEDGFSRLFVAPGFAPRTRRGAVPGYWVEDLPRGVLTGLKFSPDGRRLAISLSTATSAGDVWVLDLAQRALTRWTHSELGELDPAALAEPRLIRFESHGDVSVPAFVYRPRRVAAGERTPVIIDIHGGPESQTRPQWNPGAQYFADVLGATVILPNVRGSEGYGTRYLDLDNAERREDSVRDIGALLDWIARQPDLDASRVAVYGQSYGGYMSLAAMMHYSDRLVGGVERYGISNWISFLQNTEAYRRDNRRGEYGDERVAAMRAVFERISPLNNVRRITRPMLVMQGANDPRVPQSESDQIVRELRANGVEAWYVLFGDEGHGFLKKHNNDLRREVETVFLRRLFETGR